MSQIKERDCGNCIFFQPHDIYVYFGFCSKLKDLKIKTVAMEVCDEYKAVGLEELKNVLLRRGWIHCLTCSAVLYTLEELIEHHEDELWSDLFSDNVASEEAPTAS